LGAIAVAEPFIRGSSRGLPDGQAQQDLERMDDDKLNDRLEAIARPGQVATWVAVVVAAASLLVSLVALLK
jgi:hypothetical protein